MLAGQAVPCIEDVFYLLFRQINGKSLATDTNLCQITVQVLLNNIQWVKKNSFLVAASVYLFLRLLAHHQGKHALLCDQEATYCLTLLRENAS